MSFIYAYKELPSDLEMNGAALTDWLDLPEVNRVLNGQYRFYGNYKRDGQYVNFAKIVVKHSDDYWTYYGHLSSMNVKVGDSVTTDTVLGISGATGFATAIHLHFEVWKGGLWQRINPRDVIKF